MSKGSVMIVEDEAIVACDIERMVKDLGYRVSATVSTAEDALKVFATRPPDLMLVDVMLRGDIDGIEMIHRIPTSKKVPHIFMTAYSDDGVLSRAKETEPAGYIVKPFLDRDVAVALKLAETDDRASDATETIAEIAAAVEKTHGLVPAMEAAVSAIQKKTGWACVESWLLTPNGHSLAQGPVAHNGAPGIEAFVTSSRDFRFAIGSGLAGRAWKSLRPEWVRHLSRRPTSVFFRKPWAVEAKLETAVAIPVAIGGELLAVLMLLDTKNRAGNRVLTSTLIAVATHLAAWVTASTAKHAFQTSHRSLETLASSIHEVFSIWSDGRSKVRYMSPAFEYVWGRDREFLLADPRRWFSFLHPDDRARVTQAVQTQESRRHILKYRIRRLDGTTGYIRERVIPLVDDVQRQNITLSIAEDMGSSLSPEAKREFEG